MTTPARRVHRLLDMVVEEVSLVDRAANNRRFLLVKRDDPMTKRKTALTARQKAREGTTQKRGSPGEAAAAPPAAPPAAPAPPAATVPPAAASPSAGGTPPPDGVDKQASGPLGVALSALESLTEAVELLSTVADGEGAADLPALAGELREAADALAGAAGYEPTSDEGEGGDENEGGDEGGDVGAVITAVRSTLADVQTLLAGAADDAGATPAEKAAVDGGFGAVAAALKALTTAVTTQGERLSALEKRAGVPQSRSPETPPRSANSTDVSWPLDLNRPLDRASVDRTVSFHDP